MGSHNSLIWPRSNDNVAPHFSTLTDHIYAIVSNILVPATGVSDHFPVCCTQSVKTVKPVLIVHYVSNAWDGCACVQLYSLHKCAVQFLMPVPNMNYKQQCCSLKLLPLDKQLFLNECVLMQKVVHGKAPHYLKDLMIPSERLHVHGNKQLLPSQSVRPAIKMSFSFL